MCEYCGSGPDCCVCGRDERPKCDGCGARVDPGTGQTTAETVFCSECLRKAVADTAILPVLS